MSRAGHEVLFHRQQHPGTDVVAEHHCAQQCGSRCLLPFRHGEHRGNIGDTRMRTRWRMDVVGLVCMSADAVGKGGMKRRGDNTRADHAGVKVAAQGFDVCDSTLSRNQARTRNHGCKCIDQVDPGLLRNFLGQFAPKCARHVAAEFLHQR